MRPSWDEYFMTMATIASTRSTCNRRHVGCVLVDRNRQVVSTGYNGSSPGADHCDDVGHLMHEGHCVRTIHAEANAVAQAAKSGKSVDDCTAYVTTHPCPNCLLLLSASGVSEVVYMEVYHEKKDKITRQLASNAGVNLRSLRCELVNMWIS